MLPGLVYRLCVAGALIAGSRAKWLAGDALDTEPSDWDLLVPAEIWQSVATLIPTDAKLNAFGGWSFTYRGERFDVWPGTVHKYLAECRTRHGGVVRVVDVINNRVFSSEQMSLVV